MFRTAIDALALACGALDATAIHLVADRAEHLAMMLDDRGEAADLYRVIGTLRSIADAVDGEPPIGPA